MSKNYKSRFWKPALVTFGVLSFCSAVAFAVNLRGSGKIYDISMEIIEDGKIVSSPRVVTEDSTQAIIESGSGAGSFFRLEVTPDWVSEDSVQLSIGYCNELAEGQSERGAQGKCSPEKNMILETSLNRTVEVIINETTFKFFVK